MPDEINWEPYVRMDIPADLATLIQVALADLSRQRAPDSDVRLHAQGLIDYIEERIEAARLVPTE